MYTISEAIKFLELWSNKRITRRYGRHTFHLRRISRDRAAGSVYPPVSAEARNC